MGGHQTVADAGGKAVKVPGLAVAVDCDPEHRVRREWLPASHGLRCGEYERLQPRTLSAFSPDGVGAIFLRREAGNRKPDSHRLTAFTSDDEPTSNASKAED